IDCQIENNARGGQSGMQRKPALSGSLVLQDCRVARNQMFGVGAYAKSQLTLTRVTFEANGKTNIYKESGAIVQTDAGSGAGQASATSNQDGTDNQGSGKRKKRRQSEEDARDVLRRIFRP